MNPLFPKGLASLRPKGLAVPFHFLFPYPFSLPYKFQFVGVG